MRPRKTKDLEKTLKRKGFDEDLDSDHKRYTFIYNGITTHIGTYLSHGMKDYDKNLMALIKKQLKFDSSKAADNFFDCPFTKENYIQMLIKKGELI